MTTALVGVAAFVSGVCVGGWAVARYIGKNFDAVSQSVAERLQQR